MGVISGIVKDDTGTPVAGRVVRAYRRDDGRLVGSTVTGSGASNAVDPHYDAVVFLLSGNGAAGTAPAQESSRKRKPLRAVGGVAHSTAQVKTGTTSLYIDGTTSQLLSTHEDYALWQADFTLEAWVHPTTFPTEWNTVIASRSNNSSSVASWGLLVQNTGALVFYDGTLHSSAVSKVPLNAWSHIAASRVDGVLRLYVNGVLEYTATAVTPPQEYRGATLSVGSNLATGNQPFVGFINGLRLTRGVCRFTSSFTPIQSPAPEAVPADGDAFFGKVSLLLNFEGSEGGTSFVDQSPDARAVAIYGTPNLTTAQKKYGQSSALFDGDGFVLVDPKTDKGLLLNLEFTIELWFSFKGPNGGWIINMGGGLNISWPSYSIFVGGDGILSFLASYNNTGHTHGGFGGPGVIGHVSAGTWHHIAITRHGNIYTAWLDGVKTYTERVTPGFYDTGTRGLQIGGSFASQWGGATFDARIHGYVDSLRVTRACRYYENFTPPGRAFPTALHSSAMDVGVYELDGDAAQCNVIALDDAAGTTFNDLILRATPV